MRDPVHVTVVQVMLVGGMASGRDRVALTVFVDVNQVMVAVVMHRMGLVCPGTHDERRAGDSRRHRTADDKCGSSHSDNHLLAGF